MQIASLKTAGLPEDVTRIIGSKFWAEGTGASITEDSDEMVGISFGGIISGISFQPPDGILLTIAPVIAQVVELATGDSRGEMTVDQIWLNNTTWAIEARWRTTGEKLDVEHFMINLSLL